jgi:hypothetical protein
MKVLFLDLDGVVNDNRYDPETATFALVPGCVERLGRIIARTEARVVLCSSWRYLVHEGLMNLADFEQMLGQHGAQGIQIIGLTPTDEQVHGRGNQIQVWLLANASALAVESYVVLDDMDVADEMDPRQHPFVCTNGNVGLTYKDADAAIAALMSGQAAAGA